MKSDNNRKLWTKHWGYEQMNIIPVEEGHKPVPEPYDLLPGNGKW